MRFDDAQFGRLESLVKGDWKIVKFGNETIHLRAINYVSGNGRRHLKCYYPVDLTLTAEQNHAKLLHLMCQLYGSPVVLVDDPR